MGLGVAARDVCRLGVTSPQGSCRNGTNAARSNAPFGLTVWGWDFAASYAYPAGMGVKPINDVIIVP
jgi:hypothetical protein